MRGQDSVGYNTILKCAVQAKCMGAQRMEREEGRSGEAVTAKKLDGIQDGWNLKKYNLKKWKTKKKILFLWALVLLDGKMRWKVVFKEEMETDVVLEAAIDWKSQEQAQHEVP